ncbi:hypothetical protein JCM8208_007213 [Rhodotorula glutinis]
MTAFLAALESTSTCPAAFRHYSRFCAAHSAPFFPIPPPMLALWLHDKCTSADDWPKTYQSHLERCAAVANGIWTGDAAYEALKELDPTGRAVKEFMSERKALWHRRVFGKPARRSSSSSGSSSSSSSSESEAVVSSISRYGLRRGTRTGPSGARSSSTAAGRAQRWKARAERKLEAHAVESESDEGVDAEVVIPTRRRLRRGGRLPASAAATAPDLSGAEQNEAKRARLDLPTSTAAVGSAPPALSRRRTIITSSEASAVESTDGETVLPTPTLASPLASLSTTAPLELPILPFSLALLSSPRRPDIQGRIAGIDAVERAPKLETSSPRPAPAAAPPRPSTPPPPVPAPASPYLAVAAFLAGLQPSLVPLAPHLVAAGFDSVDALASLVALERPILELTLDLIRVEASRRATRLSGERVVPLSVIQLKLLGRRLGEEGEAMRA